MGTLPFAATFDALAFIVKEIRSSASNPHVYELVPALCFVFNSCSWDDTTGRILENIPYGHFRIGWYRPEAVTDAVEVDIWGRKVFVHPDTLSRLAGKQLVLRAVNLGGRRQGEAGRPLLIAVARAS